MDYDFQELKSWKDKFSEFVGNGEVTYLDADEFRNRVVVGISPGGEDSSYRSLAKREGIPEGAVEFIPFATSTPDATLRDSHRPAESGWEVRAVGETACTLGFVTVSGSDTLFVTASHCSSTEYGLDSTAFEQDVGGPEIGWEIDDQAMVTGTLSFGGGVTCGGLGCRGSDAQLSQFYDTTRAAHGKIARTTSVSTGQSSGSITISTAPSWNIGMTKDISDMLVGMDVDKVGRTTGWTGGEITSTCVSVAHPGGTIICGMETDYFANGGDSGAPVFRIPIPELCRVARGAHLNEFDHGQALLQHT